MEALIYFIFWGFAIFLMMRFGCGAHVMGHGHGPNESQNQSRSSELRWIPPEEDRDPVCGSTVATSTAKPSVHDGVVYYFCSRDCREQFEAAPHIYVGGAASDSGQNGLIQKMEKSHV
jgi:YHS domain-containing protein